MSDLTPERDSVWGNVPEQFRPALAALHEAWSNAPAPTPWPEFIAPLATHLSRAADLAAAEQEWEDSVAKIGSEAACDELDWKGWYGTEADYCVAAQLGDVAVRAALDARVFLVEELWKEGDVQRDELYGPWLSNDDAERFAQQRRGASPSHGVTVRILRSSSVKRAGRLRGDAPYCTAAHCVQCCGSGDCDCPCHRRGDQHPGQPSEATRIEESIETLTATLAAAEQERGGDNASPLRMSDAAIADAERALANLTGPDQGGDNTLRRLNEAAFLGERYAAALLADWKTLRSDAAALREGLAKAIELLDSPDIDRADILPLRALVEGTTGASH